MEILAEVPTRRGRGSPDRRVHDSRSSVVVSHGQRDTDIHVGFEPHQISCIYPVIACDIACKKKIVEMILARDLSLTDGGRHRVGPAGH